MRSAATAALVVLLAACGQASESDAPMDAGDSDVIANDDEDAPDDDVVDAGTGIDIAASQGTWQADEDVTLEGAGSGDLGAISIAHGVGTLTFQGRPLDAFYFVGSSVPLGDAGSDSGLAQERDLEIIAVGPERIVLTWITCDDGDLAYVYYETTDGIASSKSQPASGMCDVVDQTSAEAVSLPPLSMGPPTVVAGFSITGPQLSLEPSTVGTATFGGATWTMYPFHVIDCSACATPGWYELHSLFWSPSKRAACAGILYLEESAMTEVELAYLLCLPSVTSPIANDQLFFGSSWTKG